MEAEVKTGILVDATGRPLKSINLQSKKLQRQTKAYGEIAQSYLVSLGATDLSARTRATSPLMNHPWVAAGAIALSIVAGQAPFRVFRETTAQILKRKIAAKEAGKIFCPKYGSKRRAMERHIQVSLNKRLFSKSHQADFDHQLLDVTKNPNPHQNGNQMWEMTHMMLGVFGEAFWVLTDKEGLPTTKYPEKIWPSTPGCFQPLFASNHFGELTGWRWTPARWDAAATKHQFLDLSLEDVVQFKYANPYNPVRGMSRISAAAAGIEQDMLIKTANRKLLENDSVPRGIVDMGENAAPPEVVAEYKASWRENFEGTDKVGRTAFMSGGMSYDSIAFDPQVMGNKDNLAWDRDEILALMQIPPSVLGLTQFTNYATQLGQDRNFWDKNILPMFRAEEASIDASPLMAAEPDTVFGAFDITNVEALRLGLEQKIKIADKLTMQNLHMPPRIAYDIVGLDAPAYEGDDIALVNLSLVTTEEIQNNKVQVETEDPEESSSDDDRGPGKEVDGPPSSEKPPLDPEVPKVSPDKALKKWLNKQRVLQQGNAYLARWILVAEVHELLINNSEGVAEDVLLDLAKTAVYNLIEALEDEDHAKVFGTLMRNPLSLLEEKKPND